ncbi:MAG: LysR family transcriptional regulator [Oscillospiraceae bacterium]|nr:LysR family transcriptional regulator [Oscillospiraceae bacterium]
MVEKLRYFLCVAQTENMAVAAQTLHVTQPALSASIARLERQVGVRLFDRSGRGSTLNEAGRAILPYAERVCAAYDEFLAAAQDYAAAPQRPVRVGYGMSHVLPILSAYQQEHPKLMLNARQYLSFRELKAALGNREIDLAICAPPVTGAGIECKILYAEPFYALVHGTHPLAKAQSIPVAALLDYALVGFPGDYPISIAICNLFSDEGLSPQYVAETESSLMPELLLSDPKRAYIAVLPKRKAEAVSREYPALCTVPLRSEHGDTVRQFGISRLRANVLPAQAKGLEAYVADHYKKAYNI